MKYIVDIHGEIDGDYDIIKKYDDPKTGKWIEHDDGWANVCYECSVCKEPFVLIDGTPADNLYNFCPNCGADMREGDAE